LLELAKLLIFTRDSIYAITGVGKKGNGNKGNGKKGNGKNGNGKNGNQI